MYPVDIVTWAQAEVPGGGFYVDRIWRGDRWHLEHGPIRLAQYHADILRHCFTPDGDGRLPYDVIAWCEPAKSGKSAIAGLCAEYAALHLDGDVILASNKRNQAASLMYRSLTDSVQYNPHLHLEPGKYEVEFRNGNVARAIASNNRTEAGARFSLALFDELWGYVYQDAERLWAEYKTDPTRQSSLKMAVGYAGYIESKLWLELLSNGLAGEPVPVPELVRIMNDGEPACWRNGRQFTFWSHQTRQPWQTPAWVESQQRTLRPAEFRRMILCEFSEGQGDFLPPGVWESLIELDLQPLQPGSPEPVWVGVDLAVKARGDDCAIVVLRGYKNGLALALHKLWPGADRRADLDLATVEAFILWLAENYNVQAVGVDPWQAAQMCQRLARAGLHVLQIQQNPQRRGAYDAFLWRLCMGGDMRLYDDPSVRSAAAHASAKEIGNSGHIFIKKGGRRSGKVDFLVAMSNALGAIVTPRYETRIVDLSAYGALGDRYGGRIPPDIRQFLQL